MKPLHLSRRDLRLASGLVLFAYVSLHFVNHALGLASVALAERGLAAAMAVWHSVPGTVLLYGAFGVHLALALEAIWRRRTLRMARADFVRIVLGLGIPTLLIAHAVGTRLAWEMYRESPQYARVVWSLSSTDGQGRQLALLAPGWLHGCIGVHFAFARRPLYQRLHRVLFAAALLLPVLGGLGFLAMGKELATSPALQAQLASGAAIAPAANARLAFVREALLAAYFAAIGGVFAARAVRARIEHRFRPLVAVAYPQRSLRVPRGWSVLEASRANHLPHLAMCGGRGRCSTCRVRVTRGLEHCPPPAPMEQATLARIRAGDDVRLACQLRPRADIAVVPLLRATAPLSGPPHRPPAIEREVALVRIGWRDREAVVAALLPHDAVFLAGLFGDAVAAAMQASGGVECESGADGAARVFGADCDAASACRRALSAAHAADRALRELAHRCETGFGVRAEFSISVHAGSAALGELGSEAAPRFAAAGAAVEASRALDEAARRTGVRILVSTEALERAGVSPALVRGWRLVEAPAAPRAVAPESLASLRAVL